MFSVGLSLLNAGIIITSLITYSVEEGTVWVTTGAVVVSVGVVVIRVSIGGSVVSTVVNVVVVERGD